RLVYIEPSVQFAPSINPFDPGMELSELDEDDKYQLMQTSTQLIGLFLNSLLKLDLTGKQNSLFEWIIPAVIHIPGATLDTFVELLHDGGYIKHQAHIARAHPNVLKWFRENMSVKQKGDRADIFADTK